MFEEEAEYEESEDEHKTGAEMAASSDDESSCAEPAPEPEKPSGETHACTYAVCRLSILIYPDHMFSTVTPT